MAILGGVSGSRFGNDDEFAEKPFVIFDFETTGLDKYARITEIGAVKYWRRREIDRFSTLVNPQIPISNKITQITGITSEMLKSAPTILTALPQFHDFLRGSIGVAHNAEFDVGILHHESQRVGIQCDYTVICTLKLARAFLKIERRNLDALAAHFNLSFESRHRAIGDILVTAQVLWNILDANPQLRTIQDLAPFRELFTNHTLQK